MSEKYSGRQDDRDLTIFPFQLHETITTPPDEPAKMKSTK